MTQTSIAWHYFISAQLLPSHNISEFTHDRALLNYSIQMGGTTSIVLGSPSLIYPLYVAARVRIVVIYVLKIWCNMEPKWKKPGITQNIELALSSSMPRLSMPQYFDEPFAATINVVHELFSIGKEATDF
ncbi:hypothetical protein IEQ34_000018 [Dendrobium chrysotoxum]|uniref:Uncharacterized protein n=1 Tax=Dendrobium chrysotoxum TaxID=161865 RepID=A0AAV7H7Y6_DENCH|nr:hypothetical protein IEQ34_000018 [Dendrobium chrysotoxum]